MSAGAPESIGESESAIPVEPSSAARAESAAAAVPSPAELNAFWFAARKDRPDLPARHPEAWAFGATPEQADELLALVLDGIKTATASALWDYEATGESIPEAGELSIVLDGSGRPRAVLETTNVEIVPFDQVDAAHAHAEGEGDRTLEHWRRVHEAFWREHGEDPRGFEPEMPVVCERFRLLTRQ